MINYWDKKPKSKRLHVLEADIIIVKNPIDLRSLVQRMNFWQDVFQMTAITLMTHLNLPSEVVNHSEAFFSRYGTNLLIDGHFEFSNGLRIVLNVLQEPPEIKIWSGVSDRINAETTVPADQPIRKSMVELLHCDFG